MPRRLLVLLVGVCGILVPLGLEAQQELTRKEADSMDRKLAAILERGSATAAKTARALRTSFTEREVNAYFKFSAQPLMPTGVLDPRLTIGDGGQLQARAVVDLDAVRKSKQRGWTDPLAWVTGSVEVRAAGTLQALNGKGTFQLQSATLGGLPIPKSVLQELVSYYSRTPEDPQGFNLDKPFDLPHNIRQVEIQRGAATVVQ